MTRPDRGRLGQYLGNAQNPRLSTAARLDHAALAAAAVDDLIRELVARMRSEGASWAEVGLSLGVTKQAAQQRYGPRRGSGGEDDSDQLSLLGD